MSEPYSGPDCPFCGHTDTIAWNPSTAIVTGYRCECPACLTRWDFPAGDPADLNYIRYGYGRWLPHHDQGGEPG